MTVLLHSECATFVAPIKTEYRVVFNCLVLQKHHHDNPMVVAGSLCNVIINYVTPMSPRHPVHCDLLHNLCHLHVSLHHDIMSIATSSTTSVTSMSLFATTSGPLRHPPQPLSPPYLSSPRHPVHCDLLHNLCHLHVSLHHDILSIGTSSTTSVTSMSLFTTTSCPLRHPPQPVTSMSLFTTTSCPLRPPPQPLSPPCVSSPRHPVHWDILHDLCHLHVSLHHDILSIATSSTTCHLHVSLHHDILSIATSSTTSVTSMSLFTTTSCPLRHPPRPLSPPCLSSPRHPVHWDILHDLCHLHVSLHHDILSIGTSSTTSVTSMSLFTTTSCPLGHPPRPLSPPCLYSPRHPVHCDILHNLCHLHVSLHHDILSIATSSTTCHLHVSLHHDILSIATSSTTSVTSMSLFTTTSCPLRHPPRPLSPPCLSSPRHPVHWDILHDLCHLHVSLHHDILSIGTSSTTSVTSMSLFTTTSCPLGHPPRPLSPPCLYSPRHPVHCDILHNLCHLHVSLHHDILSIATSSTTSVTPMSFLTTSLI